MYKNIIQKSIFKTKQLLVILVLLLIFICIIIYYSSIKKIDSKKFEFINKVLKCGGYVVSCSDQIKDEKYELAYSGFTENDILNIQEMYFFETSVSKRDIESIVPLNNIEIFDFTKTKIDGEIFEPIKTKYLEQLIFRQCHLSDDIGYSLRKMKRINYLGFMQVEMSDKFFEGLTRLEIETLVFIQTPISDKGLKKILPLKNLTFINLCYTQVTDGITEFFDECLKLETIILFGGNIRCTFIRDMQYANSIKSIWVDGTNLDDDILSFIIRFKNLKKLTITNCKVTEKSKPLLEALAKKLWCIDVRNDSNVIFYHLNDDNYY
jgi:hypothetical protein